MDVKFELPSTAYFHYSSSIYLKFSPRHLNSYSFNYQITCEWIKFSTFSLVPERNEFNFLIFYQIFQEMPLISEQASMIHSANFYRINLQTCFYSSFC